MFIVRRLCLLLEFIFKIDVMRKLFFIFLLLFGFEAIAQNNSITYRFLPTLSSVNLNPVSFQINFTTNNLFAKADNLTLYNPITNLNDNYYVLGKSYVMSNTKSFPMYGFEGQRVDSFNPSGTKDLGSVFIFGAITSILGKF